MCVCVCLKPPQQCVINLVYMQPAGGGSPNGNLPCLRPREDSHEWQLIHFVEHCNRICDRILQDSNCIAMLIYGLSGNVCGQEVLSTCCFMVTYLPCVLRLPPNGALCAVQGSAIGVVRVEVMNGATGPREGQLSPAVWMWFRII